jgi:predicted transcriptional regulator of viral defense system
MNEKPNHDHLYEIAEEQGGYFTPRQAQSAGYNWERLSYYVKTGNFLRVAHGVYRLKHFPASPHESLFVAWLRTGPHSVISHESALALYELSDVMPGEVHVIIPRTASRRRKGLRLHTNQLAADEISHYQGLPVTTVARTIADVAYTGLEETLVKQAIEDALQRGLTIEKELQTQAERRGGRARQIILAMLEQG